MDYIEETELSMLKVIENLEARLITVRAGRANASMLNGINVEYSIDQLLKILKEQ